MGVHWVHWVHWALGLVEGSPAWADCQLEVWLLFWLQEGPLWGPPLLEDQLVLGLLGEVKVVACDWRLVGGPGRR